MNDDDIPEGGAVRVQWRPGFEHEPGDYRILHRIRGSGHRLLVRFDPVRPKESGGPTIWAWPKDFASIERIK